MGTTGNQVGELVFADHVAPTQFDPVHVQITGDLVQPGFNGVVGRGLTKAPHGFLRSLVGHHGDGVVLHTLDAVRPNDRAHRFAQLQR